jgi:probable HAF family extracellular repeat protein
MATPRGRSFQRELLTLSLLTAAVFAPAAARGGFYVTELGVLSNPGSSMGSAIGPQGQTAGTASVGAFTNAFFNNGSSIHGLGTLGGSSSEAFGINSGGVVVGDSLVAPNSGVSHAFMSGGSGGGLVDLGVGTGQYVNYSHGSTAAAVNGGGTVAGSILGTGGASLAVTWTGPNQFTPVGSFVPGASSAALGINGAGTVTGWANTTLNGPQHAFRASGGGIQDLGTLPGFLSSRGNAINAAGVVAGSASDAFSNSHAFLATGAALTDLTTKTSGISGLSSSAAYGINSSNIVVGDFGATSNGAGGFIWDPVGMTMYDLNNLIYGFPGSVNILGARGINGSNEIVATAMIGNQTYGVLLTPVPGQDLFSLNPVPEPSSVLLLGLGLAAGIAVSRLRRGRMPVPASAGRAVASRAR